MDDYSVLLNMRFTEENGLKDYAEGIWVDSGAEYKNTGVYGNKACTITDETSLSRRNGYSLYLDSAQAFTISFWIKTYLNINKQNSYIFSDGSTNTVNSLYFKDDKYLILKDNLSNMLQSVDISSKFKSNDVWNHIMITREEGSNLTSIFLNSERIAYSTSLEVLNLDAISFTIGKCNSKQTFPLAYLDDFVIIKDFCYPMNPNTFTINIPSNYLVLYIDPTAEVDLEGWEDEEKKFSRYDHIVKIIEDKRFHTKTVINQLQNGLVPYLITPNWKIWEHEYPKNGKAFVSTDHSRVNIDISNSIKNLCNFNGRSYQYVEGNLKTLVDSNIFIPFLLFINGRMIPWSDITLIKSNRYLTLSVAKYSRRYSQYIIKDIRIIILPFNVSYTEEGKLDEDSVILFSFTKNGLFKLGDGVDNTDILVGSKQPNIRTLTYRNQKFKDFYVNSNMDERLVKSNIYLFSNDGLLIPNPEDNDETIYRVVTIAQSPNQLITVNCNGIDYTESFRAPNMSKYSITVTPDIGYTAGILSVDPTGILLKDMFVSVDDSIAKYYTVTIVQSEHQRIVVTCNNVKYSSSFTVPYGTKWTAEIVPDEGYNPGTLSAVEGYVSENTVISCTDASLIYSKLIIPTTPNQKIVVKCDGKEYTSGTISMPYGTKWTATVVPNEGYYAGTLNQQYGNFSSDVELTITSAEMIYYTINIIQSPNQTISVSCNGKTYTSSFRMPYRSVYSASLTPHTGYNAGRLNITNGTLMSDVTISATDSSIKWYTVNIVQSAYQTITVVCNGNKYTSSFSMPHGSNWNANVVSTHGDYITGILNMSSGTLTSNITISASSAVNIYNVLKVQRYTDSGGAGYAWYFYEGHNTYTVRFRDRAINNAKNALNNYNSNTRNWVDCKSGARYGNEMSCAAMGYNAIRITTTVNRSDISITSVRAAKTGINYSDGATWWNRGISFEVINVDQWHKDVIALFTADDNGDYHDNVLYITANVGGHTINFQNSYWVRGE